MPGLIDYKSGINKTYLVSEQPVADLFRQKFGMEVFIENDAKTRAFAELKFGLARKKQNVLVLNLDWGIGLGIIVNGKLYRGHNSFAGEFGHIPIINNKILCACGKQGCLETVASGTAISRLAMEGIKSGSSTFLNQLIDAESGNIEIDQVVKAAALGDQYSVSILVEAGQWLGKGFAYLIQIFNPQLIILGGRMAEAERFILPPIQQAVQIFCNPDLGDNIKMETSKLGVEAGVQGVVAMLLEYVLDKR
jgi:predicted NBD/HSP70 family sugar kinase